VSGHDPLHTPFATIPPGMQNPDVEIFAHTTASCTVAKENGRWVITSFTGSLGPIP
jgi:hypothetical protein